MRRLVGFILVLIGAGITGLALFQAVGEFSALYRGAEHDPLAEPEVDEKARGERMLTYVVIGAAGVVPLAVGTVLIRFGRRRT